jgi:phosphatidylglycerophosphate synthase
MARYSMHEIKDAYIQKKDWEKQFPLSYFLFRSVSFYMTYLIIRITESPSLVAWIGFTIGLAGCFAFLFISRLGIWPGILLVTIFSLLDAVDGNIARVTKNVTYCGKYLDGIIGIIIEASYFFCLGLGLYLESRYNNQNLIMLASVIILSGRLFSSIFETYYDNLWIQKQKIEGDFQETLTQNIQSSTYRKYWWYLIFANLHTLNVQLAILVLCAAMSKVDLFLFFFALYYISRCLITLVFYLYRARRRLI